MASIKMRRIKKVRSNADRPRLVVFKSIKYIYGQIIDDENQITLIGASNISNGLRDELKKVKTKVEQSKLVGKYLAKLAIEKNIEKVIFDRNGYRYHGRVKALAEGAREGGLEF